jgi:phage shock protein PspC (stress-responsive transcriptional regulator)
MKKTLSINISGIIFHIDEDAYEMLSLYLEKIRSYFTKAEGCDEIIADIEARIAEMLHQKISDSKQVITIDDIEEIIGIMGKPEEIGAENGSTESKKTYERHNTKRLFRDPDNKVIGGVCSGISAYFNIDPIWIRIGFVAALFLFGSGPLLYLILWIVIPEARTTAEKLEMKGEPININNIEKSINDELGHLKSKFKDMKNEAKDSYKTNFRNLKNSTASERFAGFLLMLIKYTVRFIAIIIGIVFIVMGIFLVTGFITSFFRSNEVIWISSMGVSNFSIPYFLNLVIGNSGQITLAIIGLILFLGIPLIMLIYNGIKLVFGIKTKIRFVGISALSLWFAGLILCIIVAISTLSNFSHRSIKTDKIQITNPADNMLKVYLKNNPGIDSLSDNEPKFMLGQWNMISNNGKTTRFGIPELVIVKSDNDLYQMVIYSSAKGTKKEEAETYISHIKFNYIQNDTALILDPFFTMPEKESWRVQNVRIVLKVPVWKGIYLNTSTGEMLRHENTNDEYEHELQGKKWIMTDNGLKEFNALLPANTRDSLKTKKDSLKHK